MKWVVAVVLVLAMVGGVVRWPASADGNEAPSAPPAFRGLTAGSAHTCAIVADGRVKCWGLNSSGQSGAGDVFSRGLNPADMGSALPSVALGTNSRARALSAGFSHTCALLYGGSVKCWGNNDGGRLGLGDTANRGDGPGEMGDALPTVALGSGRTATTITTGNAHTCALLDNGSVKCWGYNSAGQLGIGNTNDRGDDPLEMGGSLQAVGLGTGRIAVALAAGALHTCALLDDGSVKCWGWNSSGQLGLGDMNERGDGPNEMGDALPAVALGTGRTAVALAAGHSHTCALLDDGSVKCWGSNVGGRLGLGNTANRGDGPNEMGDNLPAVSLGTGRTALAVTAGDPTCALLDDASVKCWGNNSTGGLGLGDTAARGDASGEMGDNLPAVSLGTGRSATAVTAGAGHVCVSLQGGGLKCWGNNNSGQLGLGDANHRGDVAGEMGDALPVVSLDAGAVSGTLTDSVAGLPVSGVWVAALRTSDFSLAGGSVADGAGDYTVVLAPGAYFLYLIDPDGGHTGGFVGAPTPIVVTDGATTIASATLPPTRGVIAGRMTDDSTGAPVAGGWALALNGSGAIVGGAVTRGDGAYRIPNLAPGTYESLFLDPAGGHTPEYFEDSPAADGATPVVVGAGTTSPVSVALEDSVRVRDLATGGSHTCAVLGDGTVRCWGANGAGQLGLGDTANRGDGPGEMGDNLPAVWLGSGRTATAVTAGAFHSCALLDDGSVKCWGNNIRGQLGLGDQGYRGDGPGEMGDNLAAVDFGTGRVAVAVRAQGFKTCALLDDGSVKCWGSNTVGQLGLGDLEDRGDGPGEMGDDLPAVPLGAGSSATTIAVGGDFVCAGLDDGSVKCWGGNSAGQLGQGDTVARGDGPDEMDDHLAPVPLGTGRTVTGISAGATHACATLDDGSVKCWGSNNVGRLGLGDTSNRGDGPGEMGDSLPAVALGAGRSAASVAAGASHSCARLDDGTIKCWGGGATGRLGLGNTTNRGDTANEMGDFLPAVALGTDRTATDLSVTSEHACALLDDLSVKCWGSNGSGQLGVEDTAHRGDGPGEMGDALPAALRLAPTGTLAGTMTDASSSAPVPGAFVAILRASDFSLAGGAVTNSIGGYQASVAPGTYHLFLIDPSGAHSAGFHGAPASVSVIEGAVTEVDPAVAPTRGALSGTVTDDPAGTPVPEAWVIAVSSTGATYGVLTQANGSYAIAGLPAGSYLHVALDPAGGRAFEYYAGRPTPEGSTPLAVTVGGNTVVDVALRHP